MGHSKEPAFISTGDAVPEVTVLVLNYLRWDETAACVRSLKASSYKNCDIVLIDNGSTNDSELQLRRQFPELTFYQTGKNLGYAGGINYGVNKVLKGQCEYILVLNPDTTVHQSCVEHLVAGLMANPNAGIAGGKIVRSDDAQKIWYGGGRIVQWKGLAEHFTDSVAIDESETCRPVSFVTGCAMLVRTDVLRRCGLFDERFFLYYEDIELCARVRRMGYELIYVPRALITHNVVSVDHAVHKLYYSMRNRFLLIKTALRGADRWIATVYFCISMTVRLVQWRFSNYRYFKVTWMGIQDYFLGNFGPGRGLGPIQELFSKEEV
jgi:GT2 family glycosyltransferase